MSVVSSDDAPEPPLPPSLLLLTHWPAPCSLNLLLITCSSVLCASYVYVSSNKECLVTQSCVSVLNKRETQHYCDEHKQHYEYNVLVYWIKVNPISYCDQHKQHYNASTNSITPQNTHTHTHTHTHTQRKVFGDYCRSNFSRTADIVITDYHTCIHNNFNWIC